MANDGRCNCNNSDNNDVQNPPSTLEEFVDHSGSTSSDHATNPGANARRQPTNTIYGSKTLISEEKE
jgi:hypothetical protein